MSSKKPPVDDNENLGDLIETPHRHDVLSGRGNFVNNHSGNEFFRTLVRMHKVNYVATPKSKKPHFARIIYDGIKALDPPGRFLKQDETTKLWYEISEKKALDKARQALREGAPDIRETIVVNNPDGSTTTTVTNEDQKTTKTHPITTQMPVMRNPSNEFVEKMNEKLQQQLLELQQLQLQVQQHEIMRLHQESASSQQKQQQHQSQRQISGSSGSSVSMSTNQDQLNQQLMASISSWNEANAYLLGQSFGNQSAAMLNAYLASSSSLSGFSNVSMNQFDLSGSMNFSFNPLRQSSSSTLGGLPNSFLSMAPSLQPAIAPITEQQQPPQQQQQQFSSFQPYKNIEAMPPPGRRIQDNVQNYSYVPSEVSVLEQQQSYLQPYSIHTYHHEAAAQETPQEDHQEQEGVPTVINSDIDKNNINIDNKQAAVEKSQTQLNSILRTGMLSRDASFRMGDLSREPSLRFGRISSHQSSDQQGPQKETNSRMMRMGGIAREESLRLGDIVSDTLNIRRKSSTMSLSMGDIDSTLSKMLEDSLDLDTTIPRDNIYTSDDYNACNNGNFPIGNKHDYSIRDPSAVGANTSPQNTATSIETSCNNYISSLTINNNTTRPARKNSILSIGSTDRDITFSELIDFEDGYQSSFRFEDDQMQG